MRLLILYKNTIKSRMATPTTIIVGINNNISAKVKEIIKNSLVLKSKTLII